MNFKIGDRVIELRTSLHAKVTWCSDEFTRLDIRHDGETGCPSNVECSVLPEEVVNINPQWNYIEYSKWSRDIAESCTREEIKKEIGVTDSKRKNLSSSHLSAIERSHSMNGNSQRRAQSRNSMVGNYEKHSAYKNALEIYCYYPEQTKDYK